MKTIRDYPAICDALAFALGEAEQVFRDLPAIVHTHIRASRHRDVAVVVLQTLGRRRRAFAIPRSWEQFARDELRVSVAGALIQERGRLVEIDMTSQFLAGMKSLFDEQARDDATGEH